MLSLNLRSFSFVSGENVYNLASAWNEKGAVSHSTDDDKDEGDCSGCQSPCSVYADDI